MYTNIINSIHIWIIWPYTHEFACVYTWVFPGGLTSQTIIAVEVMAGSLLPKEIHGCCRLKKQPSYHHGVGHCQKKTGTFRSKASASSSSSGGKSLGLTTTAPPFLASGHAEQQAERGRDKTSVSMFPYGFQNWLMNGSSMVIIWLVMVNNGNRWGPPSMGDTQNGWFIH